VLEVPVEPAAVLGHHTQLYDQLYDNTNNFERSTLLLEEIHNFVICAEEIYKKMGFDRFFEFKSVKLNFEDNRPSLKVLNRTRKEFVRMINEYVNENNEWEAVRSVYTFFFSILQTCDDYSSVNFSDFVRSYSGNNRVFGPILDNPEKYVPRVEPENPIKIVLGNKKPYEFQRRLAEAPKFVTLFAPCGRGKTEAALIWAFSAMRKYGRKRVVFAMPTQTTSNAMYDRLKVMFGEENVGLYHGRSFVKLKEEVEEKSEDDEWRNTNEIRGEVFKGNVFFKPITITTVDHLLYSFVKGFRQADFALGNLQNSVIVFDEVHYYEKMTLEHLLTLFRILVNMDIPHMLMSGTLPDFMLRKLGDRYVHVVDSEGLNFTPFKMELNEISIFDESVIDEIAEKYEIGLTQFVILNTVDRAVDFYQKLKERLPENANLMVYHSQFTYVDRIRKENEIKTRISMKPFILVATQVIEISLDISCDIMYSELAPPDALGQRAGRLNRGGETWKNGTEHAMNVYLPENHHPYERQIMDAVESVVENYIRPVTYRDVKNFCDEVYANYTLETPTNLQTLFRKSTIFGHHWKDITFDGEEGRLFNVRDAKIQYIDVVPECIYEAEGENALRVENMAKIPLYFLLSDLEKGTGNFYTVYAPKGRAERMYWICRYPYSYETGFNRKRDIDDAYVI
jgi:CRISPR-associated endonuclease/helicase Cas3